MKLSVKELHQNLLLWFRKNGRELPWRKPGIGAYERWLSEIMLQQTRVETALPYFEKFINRFPAIADLAEADVDEVQSMWAGLGYYSRARNLHKCAQTVLAQYRGIFPKRYAELIKLPGIGPYTASAIASMAFNERVPAIDGNLERVLARLIELKTVAKGNKTIASLAAEIVSLGNAGKINEALMDLSATICKVKSPDCLLCPISSQCKTRISGDFANIPRKAPKKQKVLLHSQGYAIFRKEKSGGLSVLVARRAKGAWLEGMWDLPWILVDAQEKPKQIPGKALGRSAEVNRTITNHKIHFSVEARVGNAQLSESSIRATLRGLGSDFRWLSWAEEAESLPRPSRKIIEKLISPA